MKNVAGQAARVDADHDVGAVADIALHQRDVRFLVQPTLEGEDAEVTKIGGQLRRRDAAHQRFVLHPVFDQLGDRDHQQLVPLRKPRELRHPRHGAVLVHDFADHAGRIQTCNGGQVHCRLGLAGTDTDSAAVAPARARAPPRRARSGETCPGRARSRGLVVGSIAVSTVTARSAAEIPVVTPCLASMGTQKAVPNEVVFELTASGSSSSSSRSPSIDRQIWPRPYLAMKLITSGVTFSAAIVRSPSFSRSSSSTTMIMRPSRMASMAFSIGANGDAVFFLLIVVSTRPSRAARTCPACRTRG